MAEQSHVKLLRNFVPTAYNPLPEPMSAQFYVAMWRQQATMCWLETCVTWAPAA